jgi:hypothetical protein
MLAAMTGDGHGFCVVLSLSFFCFFCRARGKVTLHIITRDKVEVEEYGVLSATGGVFGFGQFLTLGCDGMCLTRFAHLDLKFPFFYCNMHAAIFYCNMHIATCNMHIAMQCRFFSSK